MLTRTLLFLANVFLVAYCADAGLSVIETVFRYFTNSTALYALRELVALTVVAGSVLVLPAMVLSPRLLPTVLAPLALSGLWFALGAAPIRFFVDAPTSEIVLIGLQVLFAVWALTRIRSHSAGESWLLGYESPERPAFSFAHCLWTFPTLSAATLLLVIGSFPFLLLHSLESMSEGFVRFDPTGIALADQRFRRADQEIRLVGMMHIGEDQAYANLVETFSGSSTVVLAEGVTDDGLLMTTTYSYEGVAEALGLSSQQSIESYFDQIVTTPASPPPDFRQADVDVSAFHEDTITWLGRIGEFWGSDDPRDAMLTLYDHFSNEPDGWEHFQEDVLDLRNDHLLEQVHMALADYEKVIVPWGALHLPFMQAAVIAMGFESVSHVYRPLASWGTMTAALIASLTTPTPAAIETPPAAPQ